MPEKQPVLILFLSSHAIPLLLYLNFMFPLFLTCLKPAFQTAVLFLPPVASLFDFLPSELAHFHAIPSQLFPLHQALSVSFPSPTLLCAVFPYAHHFNLHFHLFPGLSIPQTLSLCLSAHTDLYMLTDHHFLPQSYVQLYPQDHTP